MRRLDRGRHAALAGVLGIVRLEEAVGPLREARCTSPCWPSSVGMSASRLVAGPVLGAPVRRLVGGVVRLAAGKMSGSQATRRTASPAQASVGTFAVCGPSTTAETLGDTSWRRAAGPPASHECPTITRARVGGSRCSGNSQGQGRGDGNASCRHPDCQFRWSHKLPPCLIVTGGRTEMGAAIDPTAYIEAERGPVPGRVGFRADVGNRHGG